MKVPRTAHSIYLSLFLLLSLCACVMYDTTRSLNVYTERCTRHTAHLIQKRYGRMDSMMGTMLPHTLCFALCETVFDGDMYTLECEDS